MNRDKIEELIASSKINSLINKKEEEPKKTTNWIIVGLAIVGAVAAVAAVAAIAYGVYRYFTPDYLDDFDDDFEDDDDFEEDDFEDDFEDEE